MSLNIIAQNIHIEERYAVYPMSGGAPIYFSRSPGSDQFYRSGSTPSNGETFSIIDPITAVVKGMVTADEVRMPAGLAGLLALLR